jgi:hypothetical protein
MLEIVDSAQFAIMLLKIFYISCFIVVPPSRFGETWV